MKKIRALRHYSGLAVICMTIVLAALLFTSTQTAKADWFKKFLDANVTTNSASAWSSQTRGYVSGGGMTVRIPNDTSSLFNIQLPKAQFGCGGIDIFAGGFSFLDPEMLVQKLKNIMMAAAAYAFDLAISHLCESCSAIYKTLTKIADDLNSMSINDCQMGKQIADATYKYLSNDQEYLVSNGSLLNQGAEWINTGLNTVEKGLNGFKTNVKNIINDMFDCNGNEDCIKKHTIEGSLWQRVMEDANGTSNGGNGKANKYPFNVNEIAMMRALYGDLNFIMPEADGSSEKLKIPKTDEVQPCTKVAERLLSALTNIKVEVNAPIFVKQGANDFQCTEVPADEAFDKNLLFGVTALDNITKIKQTMLDPASDQAPTAEMIAFINQGTLPTYMIINIMLQESASSDMTLLDYDIAYLLGIDHAIFFLSTMVSDALNLLNDTLNTAGRLGESSPYAGFKADVDKFKREVNTRHHNTMAWLYDAYRSAYANFAQKMQSRQNLMTIRQIYTNAISEKIFN